MLDSFTGYHPLVNLIYFAMVFVFSMLISHPAAQVISLFCALIYVLGVKGGRGSALLKLCLPAVALTALFNPLFNHEGATVLFYFEGGNPLTLESILYGLSSGVMLVTVLTWFSSFSRVMTSDKFIYLFGRIMPSLSLVLSMSLRFVPRFIRQTQMVAEAQKCIGRDISKGSLKQRSKIAVGVLSATLTWALENAMDTADSMKSRGYGLKGRTAYNIYSMDDRDLSVLIWLGFCGLFVSAGYVCGTFDFGYFPQLSTRPFDVSSVYFYVIYFGLCITPMALNAGEELKWKTIYSKM